MPAHFTSNDEVGKVQTFMVNVDIPANDEYEMASTAFYEQPNDPSLSEMESALALMTGEDLILGAFLLGKAGLKDEANALMLAVLKMESEKVEGQIDFEKVYASEPVKKYFSHCVQYGTDRGASDSSLA